MPYSLSIIDLPLGGGGGRVSCTVLNRAECYGVYSGTAAGLIICAQVQTGFGGAAAMTSQTVSVLRHDDAAVPAAAIDGGASHGTSTEVGGQGGSPLPPRTAADDDEVVMAMKEDLGDWLGALHGVHVDADQFFDQLDTGVLLCRHANAVHSQLGDTTTHVARLPDDTDHLSKSLIAPAILSPARSANLPEGLFILASIISSFFSSFFHFLIFLMISWRQIISRSTGPIFTIFTSNEFLCVDDRSGPFFSISQGTLPWQPIL